MRPFTLMLTILLALTGISYAQENAHNSNTATTSASIQKKFKAIDTQTFGSGRCAYDVFYYEGLPLQTVDQYKRVIEPLGDAEADHLIEKAGNEDGWGNGLFWGGLAMNLVGWTDFAVEMGKLGDLNSNGTSDTPNLALSMGLVTAGTIGWVGGLLLQMDSSADRYNAAVRYNYVVNNTQNLSWNPLPDGSPLGFEWTQSL